ncbi:hypothetical protein BOTU111921_15185 [Bordetella tumbae]
MSRWYLQKEARTAHMVDVGYVSDDFIFFVPSVLVLSGADPMGRTWSTHCERFAVKVFACGSGGLDSYSGVIPAL